MPELPEVQALVDFLDARMAGLAVAGVELASVAVLKTYDPPPQALAGLVIEEVTRRGKFLDVDCDGLHLVFHLAKAGWVSWSDALPDRPPRPGRARGGGVSVALRLRLSDGGGFDLTEAGTRKGLAAYIVTDPAQVPGIAALGPDPLSPEFSRERFGEAVRCRNQQVKRLLRDQSAIAGIGNAYSDEILHAARLSPFAICSRLDDEEVDRLYECVRGTLAKAVLAASGHPAAELKDAKRAGMAVHGRAGEPCPVCGDVVREVSFADSSLQYCATCQTDGKPLADRRTSRFVK